MGSCAMSSDNSNKGPLLEFEEAEEEFVEDASSTKSDEDVDEPLVALESSRDDDDEVA